MPMTEAQAYFWTTGEVHSGNIRDIKDNSENIEWDFRAPVKLHGAKSELNETMERLAGVING